MLFKKKKKISDFYQGKRVRGAVENRRIVLVCQWGVEDMTRSRFAFHRKAYISHIFFFFYYLHFKLDGDDDGRTHQKSKSY